MKKRRGGGMFDVLLGVGRIRGQRYEHWLEQRLVLHFNDVQFVNEVRKKFGYDKTNIVGKGQFTKQMMINDVFQCELCCETSYTQHAVYFGELRFISADFRDSKI